MANSSPPTCGQTVRLSINKLLPTITPSSGTTTPSTAKPTASPTMTLAATPPTSLTQILNTCSSPSVGESEQSRAHSKTHQQHDRSSRRDYVFLFAVWDCCIEEGKSAQ